MATQWYWREQEWSRGPVSFRELVLMVRGRVLEEESLVRPHYSTEWQEAASVVGLFHMAGRADAVATWEEERRQKEVSARLELENAAHEDDSALDPLGFVENDEMLSVAESLTAKESCAEEPAWQRRLREVEVQRVSDDAERREVIVAEKIQHLKDDAIAAAVANIELKEATRRNRWSWNATNLQEVGGKFLPWVFSIVTANLVVIGILMWTESEAQRFPDPQAALVQMQVFPIWGKCPAEEYTFLLVDTMLVAAIIGFIGGKLLVSMADE